LELPAGCNCFQYPQLNLMAGEREGLRLG
jgi:hypothetical protein